MPKILKRWHPCTLEVQDVEFQCQLKALKHSEAPELIENVDRMLAAIGKQDQEGMKAELASEWLKGAFEHYVRAVEDLQSEDGTPIVTGADLYKEADLRLLIAVAMNLKALAFSPGKVSPSPSTSQSAPPDGESPAPPASTEGGTAPETAPENPTDEQSSGTQG